MPTPTYIPLATVTLASTDTSVTFSSIPATYRDLILVFSGSATADLSTAVVRVNGDSGSNYSRVRAVGYASTTQSASSTDTWLPLVASDRALNTTISNAILQIMDYSATDKHKTALLRNNNNNAVSTSVVMSAARWANTSAITSLEVLMLANSLAIGTTLSIYGIAG